MTARIYVRVAAICIAVLLAWSDVRAAEKSETTGRVVARDIYLALPRTSSTGNADVFVLKTNEPVKGRGASTHFLRVRYEDYANQHPLPTDLLEGKQPWRFLLKRDRSCDQLVSEGLILTRRISSDLPKAGTYILVQSADVSDVPPLHSTMPCFILRPGGVKPVSGQP